MVSSNRPGTVDYSKWDSIADSDSDGDESHSNTIVAASEAKAQLSVQKVLDLLYQQLEIFCGSDTLSLFGVGKLIDRAYAVGATPRHGDTFLHLACENENTSHEIVASLLRAFPDAANVRSHRFFPGEVEEEDDGSFALHHACTNRHCPNSVIELLVKKNPNALRHLCIINEGVRFEDDDFYDDYLDGLPLHYYFASRAEIGGVNLNIVKLMVEAFPKSLTTGNNCGVMPICILLCQISELSGVSDVLKYLIEKALASLQSTVKWDLTPLHIVCGYSDISTDIVQMMIDGCPESLNQKDSSDCLPIHTLCWNRELGKGVTCAVLSLLIKASPSSVCQFDEEGQLPIHCVTSLEACKMLVNAYPDSVRVRENDEGGIVDLPIHVACSNRAGIEMIQYLLDLYPESISIRDSLGDLPIHFACRAGCGLDIVKLLLDLYPDSISIRGYSENLPIHCACYSAGCGLDIVKFLLDLYPESITVATEKGNLPIHTACSMYYNGKVEVVEYLLDVYPAGVKAKNNDGDLPIHKASSGTSVEIVDLLLRIFPASISAKNNEGYLPLHSAMSSGRDKTGNVARLLLSYNPDTAMVCTVEGKLPIQMACNSYNPNPDDLQSLFDAYPESISIADKDGKLPIDIVRGRSYSTAKENAIKFLEEQMAFIASLKAQDNSAQTTQDASGRLLIHRYLYEKNRPGAIKLLAQAYPKSLQVADHGGMSPLHIACDLGDYNMVSFLLGKYAGAASEANDNNKLPIQLLCERGESAFGQFEGGTKYVETVWRLLLASPETCKTWS